MTLFLSYLINGITLGSIYAIIAWLYDGVRHRPHAELRPRRRHHVGAYICFCATQYLGLPAVAGVLVAKAACTALA